jgi:hypothetical protein
MHTTQVITSGVDYIFLIVPVLVVLFGWIGACYWADAHPDVRHVGGAPGRAITGPGSASPGSASPGSASQGSASQGSAETTLAAGAADENQAEAGERMATREDVATQAEADRGHES